MHGITVVCYHLLSCCIYTVLVSLIFSTAIPTSFNVLMKMFLLHFNIWQHYSQRSIFRMK